MKISINMFEKITYIYLAIPFILFLLGWLNPVLAGVSMLSIFVILYKILKSKQSYSNNGENAVVEPISTPPHVAKSLCNSGFEINNKILIAIITICFIWCILAGLGGFYYQNLPDWNMKNAIIHDLIDFSWPVVYDNNVPLTYYFGFMLPAAFVAKIAKFFGASYFIYNLLCDITLLLWTTIGVIITFIWVCIVTNTKNNKIFLVLLIFIFFSGMDILIPYLIIDDIPLQIEWHENFQFSSNMTLLSFGFNQAIVSWILTCLLIKDYKKISDFGIWGTFALFYAPLPFIGFSIYFIFITIYEFFVKIKNLKQILSEIFNIKNILSIVILLPVLYFFYKSNNTASNKWVFTPLTIGIFQFLMVEAITLILFIAHKFYKNILFYIMTFSLIACRFILIDNVISSDFCMRVSIPSLFLLMIFVIKFLLEKTKENKLLTKFNKFLIIVCLLIGSVTPLIEFARPFYLAIVNDDCTKKQDSVKTLNNRITSNDQWYEHAGNFKYYGCLNPDESIFWKYLAKHKK